MRSRLFITSLVVALPIACSELEPEAQREKPTLDLIAPGEGQEIAFDVPFVVSGSARAPTGADLERVTIVLSGATSIARTVEIGGAEQRFDVELTVPSDHHLGPDRLPLEARIVAVARVEGIDTESELRRIPLVVVDRSAPSLEVELDPPGDVLAGFDAVYPPDTSFVLTVRATDDVGGVTRIAVDAPPSIGGARAVDFPPAHERELVLAFEPPVNADLELLVTVGDAAFASNLIERTVRIRVGAGGEDRTAPALAFVAPAAAECGALLSISVAATDDASGVERIELSGEGLDEAVFGPNPVNPLALVLNATFAVSRDRALGSMLSFTAEARDASGNRAPTRAYMPAIVDTVAPSLFGVFAADARVVPGSLWGATLIGEEACTVIRDASLRLIDAVATSTVLSPIGADTLDARVEFLIPDEVCTLGPIAAEVSLLDAGGLESTVVELDLFGTDVSPPRAAIGVASPSVSPGESIDVEVLFADLQTPIATATVTLTPIALALPSPVLSISRSFAASTCADRVERAIDTEYPVPIDVRFLAPNAAIQVEATARDAAGNLRRVFVDVLVVDREPPSISFVAPRAGAVVLPGAAVPVVIEASDRNQDVASLSLTVFGPASIGAAGTTSATVAGGVGSFDLLIDATAPIDAPIRLVASARDAGGVAPPAFSSLVIFTCGTPAALSVEPIEGPVSGGVDLVIFGSGFASGAFSASLDGVALEAAIAESSTVAFGRIPLGTYDAGFVALEVTNDCAGNELSSDLPNAFRFVAPPTVELVRPHLGATAQAGDELAVTVAAVGDGVGIAEIEARIDGEVPVLSTNGNTLDAVLAVPVTATGSITVRGSAVDHFGQRSSVATVHAIEVPAALSIEVLVEREVLAVGETVGYAVLAEESDGVVREVTALVSITSSSTTAVMADGTGRLSALAPGTAVLTAQLGNFQATATVLAVTRALVFAHGDLLVSSLPSAPVRVETLLLENATATSVVATFSSTSSAVAVNGDLIQGTGSAGEATLTAAYLDLTASLAVRASPTLDIAASETWFVAGDQSWSGGTISGRAIAHRPALALNEWRASFTGDLAIAGRIDARGGSGWATGDGGRGAHGAGGGGASTRAGGASGGFGEPSGEDTISDDPALPGGDGGDRTPNGGGQGATANSAATGGAGYVANALTGGSGGGGARLGGGGGGGGGGARVVLSLPSNTLTLNGTIDASGGAGSNGGAGGGGGTIVLEALNLDGRGRALASGGAGSSNSGGGGGGAVILDTTGSQSPFIEINVDPGIRAQRGSIRR